MADRQVNDALRMVAAGSPIKSPSKGLNPLDIIGNIPSDIKDVVTGFPGGVTEYVTTLPEQLHDLVNLSKPEIQKKYGLETGNKWSAIWENPAGLLRDVEGSCRGDHPWYPCGSGAHDRRRTQQPEEHRIRPPT